MNVLIVEDNGITSKYLSFILEKRGCTIDIASSGAEAMQLYFNKEYDLIFMDLGLPDLGGITITKLMRKYNTQNKYAPIVAITAHGDNETKKDCLEAGVDLFLIKPVEKETITEVISKFTV